MKLLICKCWMLLIVVALMGCATTKTEVATPTAPAIETTAQTFYLRTVQNEYDAARAHEVCPEGVASAEVIDRFGDDLLGVVTLSLYNRNTLRVTCDSGTAHNFYLEDEEVVRTHSSGSSARGQTVPVYSDVL